MIFSVSGELVRYNVSHPSQQQYGFRRVSEKWRKKGRSDEGDCNSKFNNISYSIIVNDSGGDNDNDNKKE